MTRLRSLIKEILSSPKKKDCGCGCNTCGDKAPILTEGKFKSLVSEGLQHHIDKKISLFESVYRIGSEKHLGLIREARALWIRGIIEVSDDDKGLLETHLGHFGLYEGVEVPLDLPMLSENNLLRQAKLSSEEYQRAKRLKDFNKDDYEWNSTESLYVKEKKSKFKKAGEVSGFDMRGINEEMGEWPKELTSRYSDEYRFELEKVSPTYQDKPGRAKYRVIDIKSGELKGTPVFEKPESLMAFADDLIKPQGGTQSTNLGESLEERIGRIFESTRQELGMSSLVSKSRAKAALNNPSNDGSKVYGLDKEGKRVELKSINDIDNINFKRFEIDADLNEVDRYSGFDRNPEDPDSIPFEPTGSVSEFREDLRALFGKFKGDLRNPEFIKGVAEIMVNWKSLLRSQLNEAKKKKEKKDPPLNKPKRGGSKAYYVYVRDPKTKKIKKVSFGSGGLRAKIKNKKARNAFAARHKCSTKKDRTKAGYWSCNLPRYADQLGLGSKMNTFW